MSKKTNGIDIPWWIIIVAYVISWPIGLILTFLRIIPITQSKPQSTATPSEKKNTSYSGTTGYTSELRAAYSGGRGARPAAPETTSAQKKKKKKFSYVTLFRIIAVFLFVIGMLKGKSVLTDILSWGFETYYIEDILSAVWMLLGGGLSWFTAGYFKKRERDYMRYAAIIGNSDSVSLMKLCTATSYKMRRVRNDLQRMIDDGFFGDQAYIDAANLCFMRTPDAKPDGVAEQYGAAYTRMMSHGSTKTAEEEITKEEKSAEKTEEKNGDATPENLGLADFQTILRKIRKLDDDIRDEAVSERIRRIETITRSIFEYVGDKPEKMNQIRMFMNYYLPTTLKLLESYSRIERAGVAGQNMQEAKNSIEKTLDMLVVGFEQQMDQLFKAESIDISSDIEVLEQMMRKDGLSENKDFVFDDEYSDEISDDLGGAAATSVDRHPEDI